MNNNRKLITYDCYKHTITVVKVRSKTIPFNKCSYFIFCQDNDDSRTIHTI